jgi:hypothetical protein
MEVLDAAVERANLLLIAAIGRSMLELGADDLDALATAQRHTLPVRLSAHADQQQRCYCKCS